MRATRSHALLGPAQSPSRRFRKRGLSLVAAIERKINFRKRQPLLGRAQACGFRFDAPRSRRISGH